jgi:hypothetical protein
MIYLDLTEQFKNAYHNWAYSCQCLETGLIFEQSNEGDFFEFQLKPLNTFYQKNDIAVFGSFYVNDPTETEIEIFVLKPCENNFHCVLYNLNWIPYEDLIKNKEIENLINHLKTVYIPEEIENFKLKHTLKENNAIY